MIVFPSYNKLTKVYSHHPCENPPHGKGFLLNRAKDLIIQMGHRSNYESTARGLPTWGWLKERTEQCINPFTEPVRLSAGALVGKYHSIQEADVGPALETVADTQRTPPLAPVEELSRSMWLTCTRKRVETVRVVLNAKYWLNYSRSTGMSPSW